MTLQQRVDSDLKEAMRAKEATKLGVLRMLKSALKYATPNPETGKIEDLPLPGGPAMTIIFGIINRRSRDPGLPAYLGEGLAGSAALWRR